MIMTKLNFIIPHSPPSATKNNMLIDFYSPKPLRSSLINQHHFHMALFVLKFDPLSQPMLIFLTFLALQFCHQQNSHDPQSPMWIFLLQLKFGPPWGYNFSYSLFMGLLFYLSTPCATKPGCAVIVLFAFQCCFQITIFSHLNKNFQQFKSYACNYSTQWV